MHIHSTVGELVPPMLQEMKPAIAETLPHSAAKCRVKRVVSGVWDPYVLLEGAGTTGYLNAQTDALLALLQADYVEHQINERGLTLEELGDAWESLARKLCGW
jgi:hypothetical protein